MHGQIKTHKLKNGAYVYYRYDSSGRGLLIDQVGANLEFHRSWKPTPRRIIRTIRTATPARTHGRIASRR